MYDSPKLNSNAFVSLREKIYVQRRKREDYDKQQIQQYAKEKKNIKEIIEN
jgi:hypothetical protein